MSPLIASKALKLINNLHKDTAIVNPEDSDLSTREPGNFTLYQHRP